MSLQSSNCLLCFKSLKSNFLLETNNKSAQHLRRVFDSCAKYLNSEIKGSSFHWKPSDSQDEQTFCSICFDLADKLLQIDEQLEKVTKSLEIHITFFTKEILRARSGSPVFNGSPEDDLPDFEDYFGISPTDDQPHRENEAEIRPEEEQEVAYNDLRVKVEPMDQDDDCYSDGHENKFNYHDIGLDEDVEIKKENDDESPGSDARPKRKSAVVAIEIITDMKAEPLFSGDEISESEEGGSDQDYNEDDRDSIVVSEASGDETDDKDADLDYKPSKTLTGKLKTPGAISFQYSASKGFKCVQCQAVFSQTKELDDHSKESGHVNEKNFKCLICDKSYYRSLDLQYHRRNHRDDGRTYTCPICKCELQTHRSYKRHCNTHVEKLYNCVICKINFTSENKLVEHKKTHPEDELSCKICGKNFTYHLSLKYHLLCHDKSSGSKEKVRQRETGFGCLSCPELFTFGKELESHSAETGHVNEKKFVCSNCPMSYYRRLDLKYHMRKHKGSRYECEKCHKSFRKAANLRIHMRIHNKEGKYKCEKCNETFQKSFSLRIHNLKHGIGDSFDCSECDKKFVSQKMLDDHMNTHSGATPYQCDSCDQAFSLRSTLCRHKLLKHIPRTEQNSFDCTICEMKLTTSNALAYHMSTHTGEKPFKCTSENCSSAYTTPKKLKLHVIRVHTDVEPTFQCDLCERKFKLKEDMSKHRKNHPDKSRSYMCEECGKSYASKKSLKVHTLKFHSGHFFNCETCDNVYFSKESLENHIEKVHKKNYFCDVCGLKFETAKKFRTHQTKHKPKKSKTNETKQYNCLVCSKIFTNARNLSDHKKIHAVVREKFVCEFCGQSYLSKRGLRMHKPMHVSGKEHKCYTCKKRFTDKKEFQDHINSHQTSDKPYLCENCGTGFTRMDRLKVHSEKCINVVDK